MIGKRFVVGQDSTDLLDATGKLIATYPRWTDSQQRAVMAALIRSTPKHAGAQVHEAERQGFNFRKPTTAEKNGAVLAQAQPNMTPAPNVTQMRRRA